MTPWLAFALDLLLPLGEQASAQNPQFIVSGGGCDFDTGMLSASCIPWFIGHSIKTIFGLVGVFFLIQVFFAGYQIALSGVTDDKSAGKNRLIWSIVGFAACSMSYLIVDIILSALLG
ncbi:hypothetical protein A2635_04425 [Candidatus Peribacteria bacterium RIFCSPHIGHO2_01_FULL_51_9]|nr:MAG: hypothetical protein A2635_04425 [Candidatus Peribacteria bacterium RIFCSPHIGHO2_01_FULL_51_9]